MPDSLPIELRNMKEEMYLLVPRTRYEKSLMYWYPKVCAPFGMGMEWVSRSSDRTACSASTQKSLRLSEGRYSSERHSMKSTESRASRESHSMAIARLLYTRSSTSTCSGSVGSGGGVSGSWGSFV